MEVDQVFSSPARQENTPNISVSALFRRRTPRKASGFLSLQAYRGNRHE